MSNYEPIGFDEESPDNDRGDDHRYGSENNAPSALWPVRRCANCNRPCCFSHLVIKKQQQAEEHCQRYDKWDGHSIGPRAPPKRTLKSDGEYTGFESS